MAAAEDAADLAWKPSGVHLVGSVPLPDTATVFKTAVTSLPDRLYSIPDGETGHRSGFVAWQAAVFEAWPQIGTQSGGTLYRKGEDIPKPTQADLEALTAEIRASTKGFDPGYEKYAFESYEIFQKLQSTGQIKHDVRFQVCLPTPLSVMNRINPDYQEVTEPLYEEALSRSLSRIQDAIPHDSLLVQWDMPREIACLEGLGGELWFGDVTKRLEERFERCVSAIAEDVEVGVHLCYGKCHNERD
jgi:hypothetical protein